MFQVDGVSLRFTFISTGAQERKYLLGCGSSVQGTRGGFEGSSEPSGRRAGVVLRHYKYRTGSMMHRTQENDDSYERYGRCGRCGRCDSYDRKGNNSVSERHPHTYMNVHVLYVQAVGCRL